MIGPAVLLYLLTFSPKLKEEAHMSMSDASPPDHGDDSNSHGEGHGEDWPAGYSEPWPQTDDITQANTSEPIRADVLDTFCNFLEAEDELYLGSDGAYRSVLHIQMLRKDYQPIDIRLPTELIVGLMAKCVEHIGKAFPYRSTTIGETPMDASGLFDGPDRNEDL